MDTFFEKQQHLINSHLQSYFRHKKDTHHTLNRWGNDVPDRLGLFVSKGKMIRGSLTVLGYHLFSADPSIDVYKIAAAIELHHAALIIHDDIIDNDAIRRGEHAIHMQYKEIAEQEMLTSPNRFGMKMGICMGDISLFF